MSQIIELGYGIEVHLAQISGPGTRRERERVTAARLMTAAAGAPCDILHRPDGSPVAACGGMEISVSHSRHIAALAVSRGGRVGVDIEEYRTRQLKRIAPRVLSPAELAVYGTGDASLLRAWTLKEAAYKAIADAPADFRRIHLPLTKADKYINTDTARTAIVWSGEVSVEGSPAWLSVVNLVEPAG